jgi:1-acyl-sn-glycerol-3-phosphate acyltransferase
MAGTLVAAARTFILMPLLFVYTMLLAAAVLVAAAFDPKSPWIDRIVRHWSRLYLGVPPVHLIVEGVEQVDPATRYVVVSNHLSMFDIPALFTVLPVDGRFLAKKELFRLPVIGRAMRKIGIVEVDRQSVGGSTRAAINEGVAIAAERGYSIIVFPEGTRSRDGDLLPFKKGAFRIAIDTGLPLLPVVIEGTERISRAGTKVWYPGTARIRILPPVDTAGLTNKDDLNPLIAGIERAINENYAEMRSAALT